MTDNKIMYLMPQPGKARTVPLRHRVWCWLTRRKIEWLSPWEFPIRGESRDAEKAAIAVTREIVSRAWHTPTKAEVVCMAGDMMTVSDTTARELARKMACEPASVATRATISRELRGGRWVNVRRTAHLVHFVTEAEDAS